MKNTVMSIKVKQSEDRLNTFYLTTFIDGKHIVVDSWEYPELFRELLKFHATHNKVWNSRASSLSDNTDL